MLSRPVFRPARRLRATGALAVTAVVLLVLPPLVAAEAGERGADASAPGVGVAGPVAGAAAATDGGSGDAGSTEDDPDRAAALPAVFARVKGLDLRLPADDVVAHGFHEAAGSGPLVLRPVGTWEERADANGFDPDDAIADADGPGYLVLPTRGRAQHPTSAADVVLEIDEPVVAPVDGRVTKVADYRLYDEHDDLRIEIRPHDAPHLRVTLLHVEGAEVKQGDDVRAGDLVAARARLFPFPSQIDRFVGAALPHVHVEVSHEDA
ncbi:hypothetical protein [Egicoccus sp. AB-alg2]|uniref:hypothetical protein n=1 Tax=Egicoccus sp. AB-alg2 TaxID=3242693 RepID=UPI00359D9926